MASKAFPYINFTTGSMYKIEAEDNFYDLVLCSEVLEHLEEPERALDEIFRVSRKSVIISVPNEPIWRILNICRGKYLKDLGNTPGHIQHWSKHKLMTLLLQYGKVIDVRSPLPWVIVLMEKVL